MVEPLDRKTSDYKVIIPWLLFPIVISLSYWVASYVYLAKYPFYFRVALRTFQDYVFLWLIKSLSQFQFHPTYVLEADPGSLQPSPLLGLLPHVVAYRLFGDAGFAVVDVVLVSAFFLVLVYFLRLTGARRHWALLAAVAAVALAYLLPAAQTLTNLLFAYSYRFPRPLVSQLFFIGCLCCLVVQMSTDVGAKRYVGLSALYAVALALLVQTDVYSTFAAVVAYAIVLAWRIWRAGGIALRQLVALALTGLITAVLCTPLFIQVATGDPSIQQRMGLFVPRHRLGIVAAYATDKSVWLMAVVFVVLSAIALLLLRWARRASLTDVTIERGLAFVPVLGGSALLGPAAFLLLSPEVAQVFHLKFTQVYMAIMAALIIGATGLTILAARWGWNRPNSDGRPRRAVTTGIVAAAVLATIIAYAGAARFVTLPPRNGYLPELVFAPAAAPEHFRADLTEVLAVLGRLPRDPDRVLATNEQLVATWWVLERDGKVLKPDTFATTLRTIDLDKRFAYFHQLLGTPKAEFRDIVQQSAEMLYEQLYQATPSHTFADISDYTEEQQKIIRSTKWDHVWVEFVPISEIDRLSALLDDHSLKYRVDVIVLQKGTDGRSPMPEGFVRDLDNANFSVWLKRP